jgi:HTH-type transcriptional regulator/antitoxin HigA
MATKIKTTSKTEPKGKEHNANSRGKPAAKSRRKRPVASGETDPAYLALIRRFPLRPIRTEAELDAASAIVDELTDRDALSPTESDYLDVLGDLVEKYEDEHVEMPRVSDAEMLRSLMDEKGVRQADVVRGTGISKTVLSLVINGKRDLTREHIEALSHYFGVNPAAFLGSA